MKTHVHTHTDDQHTREVRRSTRNGAQPWPAIGRLLGTYSRRSTDCHQGNRQANTEAQDEHASEGDFFNLKAEQQDSDGRRTRNQAASKAEHHDLAGGSLAIAEALSDIAGMGTCVRILITINR